MSLRINRFSGGLNTQSLPESMSHDSLLQLQDAHITDSGEIEARHPFVKLAHLPANCHGLSAAGDKLYVFSTDDAPIYLPYHISGLFWQKLTPEPADLILTRVLDVTSFWGNPYVICEFEAPDKDIAGSSAGASGQEEKQKKIIQHFYKGVRVTAWDKITALSRIETMDDLAQHFRDQLYVDPTVIASVTDNVLTLEAREVNVDFDISLTIRDKEIDDYVSISVVAEAAPAPDNPQPGQEGTRKKVDVTFHGTFDKDNAYNLIIAEKIYKKEGNPKAQGTFAHVEAEKIFSGADSTLYFSAVNDPAEWLKRETGDGFIIMSTHPGGDQPLTGLAKYGQRTAVFTRSACQLWDLKPDPKQSRLTEVLYDIGCLAQQSIQSFGSAGVLFLSANGIRELTIREQNDRPYISDIGTPINRLLMDHMRQLTQGQISHAQSIIADQGRYWLALDDIIYVLSNFEREQIRAWSIYKPGFPVDHLTRFEGQVYIRSGNKIYAYTPAGTPDHEGADTNTVLPIIQTSFLSGRDFGQIKRLDKLEARARGQWDISVQHDPLVDDPVYQGILDGSTYGTGNFDLTGSSETISLLFQAIGEGPHILSAISLYDADSKE